MEHRSGEEAGLRAGFSEWVRRHSVLVFVFLNLGATGGFLALAFGASLEPEVVQALRLPLVFSPVVTAFALTALTEGSEGVEALGGRLVGWPARFGVPWLLISVFGFCLLAGVALAARYLVLGSVPVFGSEEPWAMRVLGAIPIFLIPGLAEEPGWRGFLQPRLQQRGMSPWLASLLVGLVWGLWHSQSLAINPSLREGEAFSFFFLFLLGSSVVIGWVYVHTESVLFAAFAHFGANAVDLWMPMGSNEPGDYTSWKFFTVVLWVAVVGLVVGRGRRVGDEELGGKRVVL